MQTYDFLMSPSRTVHCLGGMNTVNVNHNIVSSTCIYFKVEKSKYFIANIAYQVNFLYQCCKQYFSRT